MEKVTRLTSKAKYKKKKENDLSDLSPNDIEFMIYSALCGHQSPLLGMYNLSLLNAHSFRLYYDMQDTPVILHHNVTNNTYSVCTSEVIYTHAFHEYNQLASSSPAGLTAISLGTVTRAVKAWVFQKNKIINKFIMEDWPDNVAFKNEDKPAFHRLDYNPDLSMTDPSHLALKAPVFFSCMKRMTNKKAFLLKLGSIFSGSKTRKQCIWLWGPSGGGKSTLTEVLLNALGPKNSVSLGTKFFQGRFYKAALVGKTLYNVQEASLKRLAGEIKSLTGDETHTIEWKGRDCATIKLTGHFVLTSNEMPVVESGEDEAVSARLIPCHISAIEKSEQLPPDVISDKLKEEVSYIVGYAMNLWKAHSGGWIDHDTEDLKASREDSDWALSSLFQKYFAPDETKKKAGDCDVTTSYLLMCVDPHNSQGKSPLAKRFKDYLQREYGSKIVCKRDGTRTVRYFNNIRKLTATESGLMDY